MARNVRDSCEDALGAGSIMLNIHSPDPLHSIEHMQIVLEEARKYFGKSG